MWTETPTDGAPPYRPGSKKFAPILQRSSLRSPDSCSRHSSSFRLTTRRGSPVVARWARGFILLLLTFGATLNVFGGGYERPFPRILEFYQITLGIESHSPNVYAVAQDSAGFLWFATDRGVSRFDGVELQTLTTMGVAGALYSDRKGRFWIGVGRLTCVDRTKDTILTFDHDPTDTNSLGAKGVRGIAEDADGVLWIGHAGGLDRFQPDSGRFVHLHDVAFGDLISITRDGRGYLWFASHHAVARFDPKTHLLTRLPLDPQGAWVGITIGPDGRVWVSGNFGFGLYCVDPETLHLTEVRDHGKPIDAVTTACTGTGDLLVGTMTGGLKVLDHETGRWTTYRHRIGDPTSIASDHIHSICIDRAGNLWLGTAGGVSWASTRQNPFRHFAYDSRNPNGPPPGDIRTVSEGKPGEVWIGSWGGGLARFDLATGTFHRFPRPGPQIHSLMRDSRGSLWIGTNEPDGLWCLRNENGSPQRAVDLYAEFARLPHAPVSAITEDSAGNLWFGIEGISVARLNPSTGSLKIYELDRWTFFMQTTVRQLCCASDSVVWIAGGGEGLVRLDAGSGRWRRIPVRKRITSLHIDRRGRFWVGSDTGLDRFDPITEQFTGIPPEAWPSAHGGIVDIIEDGAGFLWLVGDPLIFRFDPDSMTIRQFGPANGYPRTTHGFQAVKGTKSAFLPATGIIVLGSGDGIVTLNPSDVAESPAPPRVVITGILAPEKAGEETMSRSLIQFNQPERIEVPYDRTAIEIKFAALDFTSPAGNSYAARMEGSDKGWVNLGTATSIHYGGLQPGEHVFHVIAANSNGVWNRTGAQMRIIVDPPYWQAWWFRLGALVLMGVTIMFLTRMWYARRLQVERLRVRIAHDLHDEVGSSLSSIALLTDLVHDSIPAAQSERANLEEISRAARRTGETLQDIVWVINPGHDRFENLIDRMKDAARTLLGTVPFTFTSNFTDPGVRADIQFRRNLLLAYKEMLHNVVKHAGAQRVAIVLGQEGNKITLCVTDDGAGFQPDTVIPGNGMQTMRQRARDMNGSLSVESAPGKGTTVELIAQIP